MKLAALLASLVVLASAAPSAAMTRAGAPQKFSIPFANSAPVGTAPGDATYPLPTGSQIGIKCGAASLTDGFPAQSMQPVSGGGCAPLGQDFNGILKQITQWSQQNQAGAVPVFDATFASNIGGYPQGSILSQAANPTCFWINQSDNNSNNPDTGGANWTGACPGGGIALTSLGSANAQVINATPFVVQAGAEVCWIPGFSNTGPLQINVNGSGLKNVFIGTPVGAAALAGDEVRLNIPTCAILDSSNQWWLQSSSTNAQLNQPDQPLSGGANVTSLNLGSVSGGVTKTIDCGARPLQYVTNAGAWTLGAPTSDGSCMLLIINSATAGGVGASGFTTGANVGDPIDTVNGHMFTLSIWRIDGVSSFISKALQ